MSDMRTCLFMGVSLSASYWPPRIFLANSTSYCRSDLKSQTIGCNLFPADLDDRPLFGVIAFLRVPILAVSFAASDPCLSKKEYADAALTITARRGNGKSKIRWKDKPDDL